LEHPEEAVDYLQVCELSLSSSTDKYNKKAHNVVGSFFYLHKVNFSRTSLSENDMKRVLSLRADFKVGAITSLQFHLACAS
jgi:hypothetical protein